MNILDESKNLSNAKVKIDGKVDDMYQRKTVVFKQSHKNLDEMKEKALASFSGKQPESLNLPDCQNNLTFKGIGDGIGGTQGLEVNNVEGEAISDDASEDVKQKESLDAKCDEQGSEELEQDAPQSIDCDNKEAQEQKTVTGILKKK